MIMTMRRKFDEYQKSKGRHDIFTNPVLAEIGKQYGKTVGQVVHRWLMHRGIVALAKSPRPNEWLKT